MLQKTIAKIPLAPESIAFLFNSTLFRIQQEPKDLRSKMMKLDIPITNKSRILNVFTGSFDTQNEESSFVSTDLYLTFIGTILSRPELVETYMGDGYILVDWHVLLIDGQEVHLATKLDPVSSELVLGLIPRLTPETIDGYRFVLCSIN